MLFLNRTVPLAAHCACRDQHRRAEHGGTIVKKFVLAALAAVAVGGAHAAVVDLVPASANATPVVAHRVPDLAVTPGVQALLPANLMSELPEPEVFAMMLVGLILIGYRARRESSEKFK